jgi:hypothetical protein
MLGNLWAKAGEGPEDLEATSSHHKKRNGIQPVAKPRRAAMLVARLELAFPGFDSCEWNREGV